MSLGTERRGYLSNVYNGTREYLWLRAGVLRIRPAPRGRDTSVIFLGYKCVVSLQAHGVIEITSTVPYPQEFILEASSESDAETWYDDIQASIKEEHAKIERYRELLENGCVMNKYNYSNSKRSRRYFWVADSGKELCWSRSKGSNEEAQKVSLSECIGITYGPVTTTFTRVLGQLQDSTWSCFSLLFMGRTLDLAVCGDVQVQAWFSGLQNLISCKGIGSMPLVSDAQLVARKVQLKLMHGALKAEYTFRRFLILRVRQVAAAQGLVGLQKGALVSGGALGTGTSQPVKACVKSTVARSPEGSESQIVVADDSESLARAALHTRILTLQSQIRDTSMRMRAARSAIRICETQPAPTTTEGGPLNWRSNILTALDGAAQEELKSRAGLLEWEALDLGDVNDKITPQAKASEKHARSVQKIAVKLQASQNRLAQLQRELAAANASMEISATEKSSSSTAEANAKGRSDELQARIRDLEQRLQDKASKNEDVGEAEAQKNREQATLIATMREEQLLSRQDLEALERDSMVLREKELESSRELSRTSEVRCRLIGLLRDAPQTVARLRAEQDRVRASLSDISVSFTDEVSKFGSAATKLSVRYSKVVAQCKELHTQRKVLHNLVLNLKGNIRVFIRPQPVSKDATAPAPGEPVLDFVQDTRIGIFDVETKRRKWFDFDHVFRPSASQGDVMEETHAFAASTLDGYNVCVFAYGQKASGKTHTIVGSAQNPGLSTRMVEEMLKLRQERIEEYNIQLFMSCLDVGQEATVLDLLAAGGAQAVEARCEKDSSWNSFGFAATSISCPEDAVHCLEGAIRSRGKDAASVSHLVVTLLVETSLRSGGETYVGKLHMVDLDSSDACGDGSEARRQSLALLGDVLSALASKSSKVPFGSSTLTTILKESLAGDSKALMILHVPSSQPTSVAESLTTLSFGSKLRTTGNLDKPAKDANRKPANR